MMIVLISFFGIEFLISQNLFFQVNPQQTTPVMEQQNTAQLTTTSNTKQNSSEVTLNALNTAENEVDVEGFSIF